ncbi:CBS domain-containing protein [Candidatus Bathyarchaeota archaeon]|nr:MAG: CBS domain-containing protein [Candidatus Bathyarchaeota archaeon]
MQTTVITVKASAITREAAELMTAKSIGRIPVKDNKGRLIAMADREDVAKLLVK